MERISIRYCLVNILMIAICLSIYQVPNPFEQIIEVGPGVNTSSETPTLVLNQICFAIRPFATTLGVGAFFHLVCSLINCRLFVAWLIATLIPACSLLLVDSWTIDFNKQNHIIASRSLTPWDAFSVNLFFFAFGFGLVSVFFYILRCFWKPNNQSCSL